MILRAVVRLIFAAYKSIALLFLVISVPFLNDPISYSNVDSSLFAQRSANHQQLSGTAVDNPPIKNHHRLISANTPQPKYSRV